MSELIDLTESCLALAEKGDRAAVPVLLESLRHASWRVRYAAAVALGDLADPSTVPALIEALKKEDTFPLFGQKEEFGSAHAGSSSPFAVQLPADDPDVDVRRGDGDRQHLRPEAL